MNLSRGRLTGSKPRRLAPAWRAAALSAFVFWPFAAGATAAGPAPRGARGAEADVLPGNATPAPRDLLLPREGAARADALAFFAEAIISEDNADSDKALDQYQKALALDPGYTELAVKVAFELARRGDASGGIEVLKDEIKASPKAPLPYLYLSQLYAKNLNKPEVGLKYAQQALALDTANLAAYLAVYEIYRTTGQPKKASDVLDQAAAANTADPQFWLQLGDFYLKALTDQASGALPSPEQLAKIGAVYRKALRLAENDVDVLTKAADFYMVSHQEKEAIPLYLKALKFSPASASDADQTLASIRDNLAKCFVAIGQPDSAIATLRQLIKDNPLRYESYELLAELYEKKDDVDAAMGVCQQMMLLDPTQTRNYVRIASLQMRQKKYDLAIRTLSDARVKFPANPELTYSLGLALSEAKHYPESLAIFEQAQHEAENGEMQMLDGQFYFAYGAAAEQAGQVERAAQLLRKSIDLDPQNSAEAYNYIGYMWADRGQKLDEANDLIKKALAMQPDNPAYLDSLGWCYFKQGDLKQALDNLKRAIKLTQPEDATVDEHLADIYAAQNDTAQALTYWQKALALDKDNKEIAVKIAGAKQKLARQSPPSQNSNVP